MLEILHRIAQAANAPTDTELARRLGLSQQSIAKARATQNVPASWLIKAATLFEVSLDWLYYGKPPMRITTAASTVRGIPLPEVEAHALTLLPKVRARLEGGSGTWAADDATALRYAFSSGWLAQKGDPGSMVLMGVTGDAMKPQICHGDVVLIDMSQAAVLGYGYFAVGIDGAVYVTQLRSKPGKLILHNLNPAYADVEVEVTAASPQNFRILGRVVWVGRDLV